MKITPGSRIVGKSGTILTVDRIEGDILHCGELRISSSAVIRVVESMIVHERLVLKIGDKVRYIGSNPNLKRQYEGVLTIHSLTSSGYSCDKPDGSRTSWIDGDELLLVERHK